MSVIANPTLTGNELDLARLQVGDGHYRAPFTRKNLLDNWYFVGGGDQQGGRQFPINQRKQTSYSGKVYGIDRWIPDYATFTVTIASDGVVIQTSSGYGGLMGLTQFLEFQIMSGEKYTISLLSESVSGQFRLLFGSKGTWQNRISTSYFSSAGLATATGVFANNVTDTKISIVAKNAGVNSIKIKAVKVELGDTQTLAHLENGVWVLNEIPDYTTQLLRCQRFYRVFTSTSTSTTGYGYSTNPKNLRPEMRVNPTTGSFTYGGTTYYTLSADL